LQDVLFLLTGSVNVAAVFAGMGYFPHHLLCWQVLGKEDYTLSAALFALCMDVLIDQLLKVSCLGCDFAGIYTGCVRHADDVILISHLFKLYVTQVVVVCCCSRG